MNPLSVATVLLMAYVVNGQFLSPYAKGWASYPGVLPQYESSDLSNRVGEGPTSSTGTPEEELESRVASWPRDRQPYWYVNKQHIQNQQRQPQPINPNSNQQPTSSFVSGRK